MANLAADSFLADLDELSHGDDDASDDVEALNDVDIVSKSHKTRRYVDIMQKVDDALQKGSDMSSSTAVLDLIENDISTAHNSIRDNYRLKFPELEYLVHHPIDYARVVKRIGNETDLTLVDLEGLLPSAIIMAVSMTASTTGGKPLAGETLEETIDACDRALALDLAREKVVDFVESRMRYVAPNLSAVVGTEVAARLVGTAGGLSALARMLPDNVQLLGAKREDLAGFSTATCQPRVGFIGQAEIFRSTPPSLKPRACRLVAAKSTLAARVDSNGGYPTGKRGRLLLEKIRKKIDKWQEPPPAKQPKPLPVPYSAPKKKRGGRRLRKQKERYTPSVMRELANRMPFVIPEASSLGDGLGEGFGMLGQAGSGRLRVSRLKERRYGSTGGPISGLTSSLAFTPAQGIELPNPHAHVNALGSGTQSTYFS